MPPPLLVRDGAQATDPMYSTKNVKKLAQPHAPPLVWNFRTYGPTIAWIWKGEGHKSNLIALL